MHPLSGVLFLPIMLKNMINMKNMTQAEKYIFHLQKYCGFIICRASSGQNQKTEMGNNPLLMFISSSNAFINV